MQLHRRALRSVNRGETARLRVQWDRDNHRFIFQRDDASEVFAPYAVSDTDPPASAATWLDTRHVVPNWTATPRPMAFIEAWFDEMMVNESGGPSGREMTPSPHKIVDMHRLAQVQAAECP